MPGNTKKSSAVPVAGIVLLVVIGGGFLAAIGYAVFGRTNSGPDKYRILAITQGDTALSADLPSIGRVSLDTPLHPGPTTMVWLETPSNHEQIGTPRVNLGGGDNGQVEYSNTNVPNVVAVSIPPYYPEGTSQCDLKFWRQDKPVASFHLTNLLPSKSNWSPAAIQKETSAGPARVVGRAWRSGNSVTPVDTSVAYDLRVTMSTPSNERWHVRCEPGQLANSPRGFNEPAEEIGFNRIDQRLHKVSESHWTAYAPYKAYQSAIRVRGAIARLVPQEDTIDIPVHNVENVPGLGQVILGSQGKTIKSRLGVELLLRSTSIRNGAPNAAAVNPENGSSPQPKRNPIQIWCKIKYPKLPKGTVVSFIGQETKFRFYAGDNLDANGRYSDGWSVLNGYTRAPLTQDHAHIKVILRIEREVETYPFTLTLPISETRGEWPQASSSTSSKS